jgi:hypothetical protein
MQLKPKKKLEVNRKKKKYQICKQNVNPIIIWTADFESPVCKLYLLLISVNTAQEKEKREESAAAHWCFKVCSPYSMYGISWFSVLLRQILHTIEVLNILKRYKLTC